MNRKRLNLSALRARRLPVVPETRQAEELLDNPSVQLTRREMLGVMGVATATPFVKPLGSTLFGSFRVDSTARRVAFSIGGKERWVINADHFAGYPRVSIRSLDASTDGSGNNGTSGKSGKSGFVVRLRGALFPGTDIPADFTATVRRGLSGWRMVFESASGWSAESAFEPWLLGRRALVGSAAFSESVGSTALEPILRLHGRARVSFSPDWTLRFQGRDIVSAAAPGIDVRADFAALHLLQPGASSLFAAPTKRRSLFTLDRSDQAWDIVPEIHKGELWQFRAATNGFDRLLVEAGAPGRGTTRSRRSFALCAECTDSRRQAVSVAPADCCSTFSGEAFEIPLADARYAVTINGAGKHAAVASGFVRGASWLRTDDFSLRVGKADDADGATFCLTATDGKVEDVDCVLDIHETMLHPDGDDVIVRPVALAEPRPIRIGGSIRKSAPSSDRDAAATVAASQPSGDGLPSGDALPPGPNDGADLPAEDLLAFRKVRGSAHGQTRGQAHRHTAALSLAVAPVELIRPQDLAVLRFEFRNMSVTSRGGQRFVAPDGSGAAYLIAQFQAQHITERALFEASSPSSDGMSLQDEVDESGVSGDSSITKDASSGSDDPANFPPPVDARMSGVSRLVFRVPSSKTIPFTMEGLLEACSELDMSLAGNALPPDRPKIFIYDFDLGNVLGKNRFAIEPEVMNRAGVSLWSTLETDATTTQNVQRGGLIVRGANRAAFMNAVNAGVANRVAAAANVRRADPNAGAQGRAAVGAGAVAQRAAISQVLIEETESTAPTSTPNTLIRNFRNKRLASNSTVGQIIAASDAQLAAADAVGINVGAINAAILPTRPEAPGAITTAIEAPYRLYMSPNRHNAWAHSPVAKASPSGVYELWHTRLGVRSGNGNIFEGPHWARAMRAIWSPDFRDDAINGPAPSNEPFRMALDGSDRHNLVHLTSNFFLDPWKPRPVDVRQFMLSSLGAWINLRGDFGPNGDDLPGGLSVLEWVHRSTMARDHYVKVVYAGYLFPWGHQASLIKITERKFAPHPTNSNAKVAYLFQRMFIVVREPLKVIKSGVASLDRQNPFKSAQILTLNTPNLDKPEATDYPEPNGHEQALFWPRVGGVDFLFNMRLEDLEGERHEVTMPLAFVRKDEVDKFVTNNPGSAIQDLIDDFNEGTGAAKQARRTRSFNGQTVSYADSTMPGDTAFETDTVTFGADSITARPGFAPVVRAATAIVPAVKQLMGNETPIPVKYYDRYLNGGFSASGSNKNTGEIFLSIITDAADDAITPEIASAVQLFEVNFSSQGDRSGGLVQPNMRVQGLSRKKGPVSGAGKAALDQFANGDFQPASFFGAPEDQGGAAPDPGVPAVPTDLFPKLFGVINLWDIIESTGVDGPGAPKFISETVGVIEQFLAAFDTFRQLVQGGLNAVTELQSQVQAIQQDFQNLEDDFSDVTADTFPGAIPTHLNDLLTHVDALLGAIPGANLEGALRREVEKQLNQFKSWLEDSGFIDVARAFVMALDAVLQKRIRLEWKPPIKSFGIPNAPPIFDASGLKNNTPATLTLGVEMKAEGNGPGSSPALDVFCALENFTLDLVPIPGGTAANLFTRILRIGFDKIHFFAGSSTKPGVDVVMAGIEFQGILGFVETLRDLIPLDGFSDPPYIDVDASGIRAGFDFDIPGVAVGVFSLQNISLGAELKIPFIGEAIEVSFNFNRPENPCLLSVWVFGGGAYFGVTITPRGLRAIRAAFEFGATVSLNFGVASGGVYVMAGVYFEYVIAQSELEEDSMTLIGYLRLGGHVSVLGLITLSIEMRMEIGYKEGKAYGKATIQVEVEVLFFSASVSISYEKKFKGANGDPTFLQMMGDPYIEPVQDAMVDPWEQYARAFA